MTNKLMVRVTNYFDTQVRVPTSRDEHSSSRRYHASRGAQSKSAFQTHIQGSSIGNTKMTDEQMASWYGKILESVRLRYRKLQRFARLVTSISFRLASLITSRRI
jgi:mitogen-activated protein kinase kinase kinase